MTDNIFKYKKQIDSKLSDYGFSENNGIFTYYTDIMGGTFNLTVNVKGSNVSTSLTDTETGEEYILYKIDSPGKYVAAVRQAVNDILSNIADKCFESSLHKSNQTKDVLAYTENKYATKPEYLWSKFPEYAVLRRKDNEKWYGIIMNIPKSKLGIESNETAEIIDLRADKNEIEQILSKPVFYPGWHMNKKSWYTVILDSSISNDDLFKLIDKSYILAGKSK